MPMESLTDLHEFFDEITFISYFTVKPEIDHIPTYIKNFSNLLLKKDNSKFMLLGPKLAELKAMKLPKNVSTFNSIENLVKEF